MNTNNVKWDPSTHVVSDFLEWSKLGRLELQPDFQRKEVWSKSAKIMLIDTILRNIPMPKIFLQAIIRGEITYRIVIDGQQRLTAILGFLRGEYGLESPYEGEFSGLKYQDLPEEVKKQILRYRIDVNEIHDVTPEMIRDIYSRVNKYTVQLNKQELRRADYPGDFLNLSEQLASDKFFEENRIFTYANSKRMGDVEFVSELLMLLLDGAQDKKEKMDSYYEKYMKWDVHNKDIIVQRFKTTLKNIEVIWPSDGIAGQLPPFFRSRFKQKADLYALFNAIDFLVCKGYTLAEKELSFLRKDLAFLDKMIEPESEIQLFSKYAIQCVSQSNTIRSRQWRCNMLTEFLSGTYTNAIPKIQTCKAFHNIIIEAKMPFGQMSCPICNEILDNDKLSSEYVVLGWKKDERYFQLSTSILVHRKCLCKSNQVQFASIEYETGNLVDDDYCVEE